MGSNISAENSTAIRDQYLYEAIDTLVQSDQSVLDNIVSLGSGSGKKEQIIENKYNCTVTCIDPTPNSWSDEIIKPPTFDYLDTYLSSASYKPISLLLIIWPFYNGNPGSYNEYEEILKSKAKHIIIVYEAVGGAGSRNLHKFLNNLYAFNETYYKKNHVWKHSPGYDSNYILVNTKAFYKTSQQSENITIDGKITSDKLPDFGGDNIFSIHFACVVTLTKD